MSSTLYTLHNSYVFTLSSFLPRDSDADADTSGGSTDACWSRKSQQGNKVKIATS